MAVIGLAIFKYAFHDTMLGWDWPSWKTIDWLIYIAGICVYGYFWLYLSIRIPREVQKRRQQ